MKKLLALIFMISLIFLSSVSMAQKSYRTILSDTCGNSQSKIFYVDVDKIGEFDSLVVSIVATGEIDLDSLDASAGFYASAGEFNLKGSANTSAFYVYEALSGATLTINLADGVSSIVQKALTLTKANLTGYNEVKFTLTSASSGNDATDTSQKVLALMTVY